MQYRLQTPQGTNCEPLTNDEDDDDNEAGDQRKFYKRSKHGDLFQKKVRIYDTGSYEKRFNFMWWFGRRARKVNSAKLC